MIQVNLIAPINRLGYGVTGLNILKALARKGVDVSLFPLGGITAPLNDASLIHASLASSKKYNRHAPSVRIWHAHDLALHVGNGVHFGWPIFELNKFTEEEKHQLSAMDGIIVCSEWARDVVVNNIGRYPEVVPLGVDMNIFNESTNHDETTVFFNCGKWEVRKGHDILAKAFNMAFTVDDNVMLIMNCSNPFLSVEDNRQWQLHYERTDLGKEGKILVLTKEKESQHELARLMACADCGVFPSRAEGWNLEILEMMAMGKHIITTNYSAHTEYANSYNSKLIEIDRLEPAYDGIWFHKQGEWAYFGNSQLEQLIQHMKDIHKNKQEGNLHVNTDGINTAKAYSWDNSANDLVKVISC